MKSIILLFILFISVKALAQKQETYCQLIAQQKGMFSSKVKIRVDFGDEISMWKGVEKVRDEETGKVKVFNTIIDALNYMGKEGWSLVNAFPVGNKKSSVYHFFFKRSDNAEVLN